MQERSHSCSSQFPGRGGGDAWRHRSSHFGESQLRLHLLDREDKRKLNSSAVRRGLARCEELATMFHKGRVFLCVIQQCTSLAFEKNLGMGFPWRQLPNNLIQPTLITSVRAALGFSQEVQYVTSFLILAVLVSPDSSLPVCRQRPPAPARRGGSCGRGPFGPPCTLRQRAAAKDAQWFHWAFSAG